MRINFTADLYYWLVRKLIQHALLFMGVFLIEASGTWHGRFLGFLRGGFVRLAVSLCWDSSPWRMVRVTCMQRFCEFLRTFAGVDYIR